jgi:ketosteroid isomerase-like protein
MTEEADQSVIRRTHRDVESGDRDLLGVVMTHDVVWHEPGRSSLAGDNKGPEAVIGFLGQLKARSGGTFKIEVLDVLSERERAAANAKPQRAATVMGQRRRPKAVLAITGDERDTLGRWARRPQWEWPNIGRNRRSSGPSPVTW